MQSALVVSVLRHIAHVLEPKVSDDFSPPAAKRVESRAILPPVCAKLLALWLGRMVVPMMDVWIVLMRVRKGLVNMVMRVRRIYVDVCIVFVLMMGVVVMNVLVFEHRMFMCMPMRLCQMQPEANTHEHSCSPKSDAWTFPKHDQGNQGASKRCCGKICAGSRGAKMAKGQDEEHQANPIAT